MVHASKVKPSTSSIISPKFYIELARECGKTMRRAMKKAHPKMRPMSVQ